MKENEILQFIRHFEGSEDTFLHGCCYWFAAILESRFFPAARIKYEPIEGHFLTAIDNQLYDIRGNVTTHYLHHDLYDFEELRQQDSSLYWRLVRDCRDFG